MIIARESPSGKLLNKPATNELPTPHIRPVRIPKQTLVQ